jgi:hypothetical protein
VIHFPPAKGLGVLKMPSTQEKASCVSRYAKTNIVISVQTDFRKWKDSPPKKVDLRVM